MRQFLFLTDTHLRGDRPVSRIDNTYLAQFEELGDIANLALEHDVDAILHGGDFFHTRSPSHKLVADVVAWCKFLDKPIYTVIGNHDVLGYNLKSVENTGLGVLFETGLVSSINDLVYKSPNIVIRAAHTSATFKDEYKFEQKYDDFFKIIVSHNFIIPTETLPFEFVHPKDIQTNADLVLCGHYHVPFDYSDGRTRWVNPGAISRWSINEKDRRPTALLLTIDSNDFKISPLPLSCSKSGNEIFDVEKIRNQDAKNVEIESFIESLERTTFASIDIEAVVKEAGKTLPESVLAEALSKIKMAKDVLK